MLPSRPIGETGGRFDGLHLITLVDDRYDFAGSPVTLRPKENSTWDELLIQIADSLGITLTYSTLEDVYGSPEPDSQFWANFENAALLLDAAAWNLGRVVVRNLDGTYELQTAQEAQAISVANRGSSLNVVRTAGGDLFNSGTQLNIPDFNATRNSVVPNTIFVTFPKYCLSDPVPHFLNSRYAPQRPSAHFEESYGDVHSVEVNISGATPLG